MSATAPMPAMERRLRAAWLRHLHRWHWISSAVALMALLLFSVTGITLNHAARIEAEPAVRTLAAQVPAAVLAGLELPARTTRAPLPPALADWLAAEWGIATRGRVAEWSRDEIYLSLPRAGGDAWVSVDPDTGEAVWEVTDRGWIAWANDLHKGRNTGPIWGWFIDLFAIACLVFAITGLLLLQIHARQRAATWPLLAFGAVLPLLLIALFIH